MSLPLALSLCPAALSLSLSPLSLSFQLYSSNSQFIILPVMSTKLIPRVSAGCLYIYILLIFCLFCFLPCSPVRLANSEHRWLLRHVHGHVVLHPGVHGRLLCGRQGVRGPAPSPARRQPWHRHRGHQQRAVRTGGGWPRHHLLQRQHRRHRRHEGLSFLGVCYSS